jgi:hypothetical protein
MDLARVLAGVRRRARHQRLFGAVFGVAAAATIGCILWMQPKPAPLKNAAHVHQTPVLSEVRLPPQPFSERTLEVPKLLYTRKYTPKLDRFPAPCTTSSAS